MPKPVLRNVQKRTPTRSRVYVVAVLNSGCGSEQVRIRDLSQAGALVEATAAPPIRSNIRLTRGNTSVEARVTWADSTWFGVEFTEPLGTSFLADQIEKRLKVSAPRW